MVIDGVMEELGYKQTKPEISNEESDSYKLLNGSSHSLTKKQKSEDDSNASAEDEKPQQKEEQQAKVDDSTSSDSSDSPRAQALKDPKHL